MFCIFLPNVKQFPFLLGLNVSYVSVLIHPIIFGLSLKNAQAVLVDDKDHIPIHIKAPAHKILAICNIPFNIFTSPRSNNVRFFAILGLSIFQGLIVVGKMPFDISGATLNIQGLELSKSL
jgi:hypothetical protein